MNLVPKNSSHEEVRARGRVRYRYFWDFGGNRPDGTRDQLRLTFDSHSDAEAFIAQEIADRTVGITQEQTKGTVADVLRAFLQRCADNAVAPSTFYRYSNIVDLWEALWPKRVKDLTEDDIRDHLRALRRRPGNPLTNGGSNYVQSILGRALDPLVQEGKLRTNVARNVPRLKADAPTRAVWDEEQIARFLAGEEGRPGHPLFVSLLHGALRNSEATSLRWARVRFTAAGVILEIRARTQKQLDGSRQAVTGGKTKNADRDIALGQEAAAILRAYKRQCIARRLMLDLGWSEELFVFPGRADDVPRHHSAVGTQFKRACQRQSVPYITPHGLRHTFGTVTLRGGEDDTVVSRMMGHGSVAFTKDIYRQVDQRDKEHLAANVERIMRAGIRPVLKVVDEAGAPAVTKTVTKSGAGS